MRARGSANGSVGAGLGAFSARVDDEDVRLK